MWFEALTGFSEQTPQQVRQNMCVERNTLKSHINGKMWSCGVLETPTLAELRERVAVSGYPIGKMLVREVVANVQQLHANKANAGALFQVASQFNLLEMPSPSVTPERGVGVYEHDHTQGPACAIAAGAGTIYRNYFVSVNGQIGQSAANQIDCLADVSAALQNTESRLWRMQNGYALASASGLMEITNRLQACSAPELDALRQLLRIGVLWQTQVTLAGCQHMVTQAYCAALPIAYSQLAPSLWAAFAQLVLEVAYEATICAAILNLAQYGHHKVFLTLLGGGVFGNPSDWILSAIQRALTRYRHVALDVAIVSYGSSNHNVQRMLQQW